MAGAKFQVPKWASPPSNPEKTAQSLVLSEGEDPAALMAAAMDSSSVRRIPAKAAVTLGRGDDVDIQLGGDASSRLHAVILQDVEGRKFLCDMKSTHGTLLEGQRLEPNKPVRWREGQRATFGNSVKAASAILRPPDGKVDRSSKDEDVEVLMVKRRKTAADNLYGQLPEPEIEMKPLDLPPARKLSEPPKKVEGPPTKVIFLDIDGCLRPLHGRQMDEWANSTKTMLIDGSRVALVGEGENRAGIDFWQSAMRALKHIVQKTGASIVLSSDWRKEQQLMDGVNNQLKEYGMGPLYSSTPDFSKGKSEAVLKVIHESFREKRCKEIRSWLRKNKSVVRFIAIDDIDLGKPGELMSKGGSDEHLPSFARGVESKKLDPNVDYSMFLDPNRELVRCKPTVGLTGELAKVAVCLLNGTRISQDLLEAAYGVDCD